MLLGVPVADGWVGGFSHCPVEGLHAKPALQAPPPFQYGQPWASVAQTAGEDESRHWCDPGVQTEGQPLGGEPPDDVPPVPPVEGGGTTGGLTQEPAEQTSPNAHDDRSQ